MSIKRIFIASKKRGDKEKKKQTQDSILNIPITLFKAREFQTDLETEDMTFQWWVII